MFLWLELKAQIRFELFLKSLISEFSLLLLPFSATRCPRFSAPTFRLFQMFLLHSPFPYLILMFVANLSCLCYCTPVIITLRPNVNHYPQLLKRTWRKHVTSQNIFRKICFFKTKLQKRVSCTDHKKPSKHQMYLFKHRKSELFICLKFKSHSDVSSFSCSCFFFFYHRLNSLCPQVLNQRGFEPVNLHLQNLLNEQSINSSRLMKPFSRGLKLILCSLDLAISVLKLINLFSVSQSLYTDYLTRSEF